MKTQNIKTGQAGFTLIELVMVIVILGILAAVAIPKFSSLRGDALTATTYGMAGAAQSAAYAVQATWLAKGNTALTSVTMQDGTVVTVTPGTVAGAGFPISATGGIDNAVNHVGYTFTTGAATSTFHYTNGGNASTCGVTYTMATGVVTSAVTGCL